MLHLLFLSPIPDAILARVDAKDALVFLENAVLALLQNNALLMNKQCYVLATDLAVRGINVDELPPNIHVIDYADFVALSVKHPIAQSWT